MSHVEIQGLGKSYGDKPVLVDLDLHVPSGSITGVLGPSGCGKSTLLRIIAGFARPDAGSVRIGDRILDARGTHLAPQRRGVGYVPQEGALFPHLTVAQNILFGLPRSQRTTARRDEQLDLAELGRDLAGRYPHELSGGQQQRVALARALAPGPEVVLLDEPFSSLDTALRASAGRTVTRVLRNAGATALLVTHDQGEALSLTDQVAVMRAGRFIQVDPPAVVYGAPIDPTTAAFVGGGTLVDGIVLDTSGGTTVETELGRLPLSTPATGSVRVLVRPEQVEIAHDAVVKAQVLAVDYHGAQIVVELAMRSGAVVHARGPATQPPAPGEEVGIRVVGPVRAYPRNGSTGVGSGAGTGGPGDDADGAGGDTAEHPDEETQ
jgi:iron(III) transport system ATP-binding protein